MIVSGGPHGNALMYRLVSQLVHHPRLLRMLAGVLREWPGISRVIPVVAQRNTVAAILERQSSFSNTSHAPNLMAGEFVIGMDAGARQREDRAFLQRILPSAAVCAAESAAESTRLIERFTQSPDRVFDLIDDYLVPITWKPLRLALGAAADAIASGGDGGLANARPPQKFIATLRSLAAQLITGSAATASVRQRVEAGAADLNRRVIDQLQALQQEWEQAAPGDSAAMLRNAVGYLWVSHPVTVQAGALMIQELLGRPRVHRELASQARELQATAWTHHHFRELLRNHVLELLRFRPVFPILRRDVPRATLFDIGTQFPTRADAGSTMTLLVIGAMFDDSAMEDANAAAYRPGREFKSEHDRYLIFGMGPRACIAQHQAVEILVSALAGLLLLPRLRWADPWYTRIKYEGPAICKLRLRFDDGR